jgi:NAD(P)-dependent dehydrogenase (short-subunit alcohol dehydrogenase family)
MFIQAANAALINFFETLQTELGSQVGITVVTPGWIESEMSKGKYLKEHGEVEVDQEMRDVSDNTDPDQRMSPAIAIVLELITR